MPSSVIDGKQAREYETSLHKDERQERFEAFLLESISPGKKMRICELCCGPGNNIALLASMVGEYWAVDLSKEMIAICREKFSKNKTLRLKVASATDTGFPTGYFDYIIIRMGIHHIREKDQVVDEVYRLLKPSGRFLVIDKFYLSKAEMYLKGIIKLISHGNTSAFGEYLLSKKGYEKIFSRKFEIISRRYIDPSLKHIGQSFMYVLEKKHLKK